MSIQSGSLYTRIERFLLEMDKILFVQINKVESMISRVYD